VKDELIKINLDNLRPRYILNSQPSIRRVHRQAKASGKEEKAP
jgi:hypothetical protein